MDVLAAVNERQVVLVEGVEHELGADEEQDEAETVGQVDQAVKEAVEQEVHLAQAHEREGVRGEDEVSLARDAVDGRDGVEGEHDVDGTDGYQGNEERGKPLLPGFLVAVGELIAMVVRSDVDDLAQHLDDEHVVRVGLRGITNLVDNELHGRVKQEDREQVEHVRPRRDDGSAEQNKDEAEDQSENNTDEQHLLLVLARNLEGTHDEREDEEVIDTQRLFRHVTREVLHAVFVVPDNPDHRAEEQRETDVEQGPHAGLFESRLVRGAHVGVEVKDKEAKNDNERNRPYP